MLFAFALAAFATQAAVTPSKEEIIDALKITEGDKTIGNKKASVTLIEFSSLSCPHCANAHLNILPEIMKDYVETGKVLYVYRDHPLNKQAFDAARIAHCSGNNYFKMIDKFFKKQEYWAFTPDYFQKLENLSEEEGISHDTIAKCMSDKKLSDNISSRSMIAMKVLQVDSTPIFYINNTKIEGAKNINHFRTVLDQELAKTDDKNGSKS